MNLVLFGVVAKARSLNYDAVVRKRRETGWSYAKLAQFFRVTESAVYYACNPGRRDRRIVAALGRQRSVYLSDEAWAELRRRAASAGSISQALDRVLHGEDEPLVRAALSEPEGEASPDEAARAADSPAALMVAEGSSPSGADSGSLSEDAA